MTARPDLDQTVPSRAWADASFFSLGTLAGAVLLVALAALGAALIGEPWGSVIGFLVGFALVLVVALALAATRQRDDLRGYIRAEDAASGIAVSFKVRCLTWADDVDRLYATHNARWPKKTSVRALDVLKNPGYAPPPEPVAKQIERDRVSGETMSRYIEQYRDNGVALFDQLVADGFIVATNRLLIDDPKTPDRLWKVADTMRTGAERIPAST